MLSKGIKIEIKCRAVNSRITGPAQRSLPEAPIPISSGDRRFPSFNLPVRCHSPSLARFHRGSAVTSFFWSSINRPVIKSDLLSRGQCSPHWFSHHGTLKRPNTLPPNSRSPPRSLSRSSRRLCCGTGFFDFFFLFCFHRHQRTTTSHEEFKLTNQSMVYQSIDQSSANKNGPNGVRIRLGSS